MYRAAAPAYLEPRRPLRKYPRMISLKTIAFAGAAALLVGLGAAGAAGIGTSQHLSAADQADAVKLGIGLTGAYTTSISANEVDALLPLGGYVRIETSGSAIQAKNAMRFRQRPPPEVVHFLRQIDSRLYIALPKTDYVRAHREEC